MNKPTRNIALLAFSALIAGNVNAEGQTELKVLANSTDGAVVSQSVITMDSKLRFSETGVEVYSGETLSEVFNYADIANISFYYDTATGVKVVEVAEGWKLRSNPVSAFLEPIGKKVDSATLSVADLSGSVRISLSDWHGEPVDVSDLTPGLYLVTIDKSTLKFIKK
ncbi:MAG: T9SS type A sorting domain-containing protein [Muribaculum sp.]|nr:T9SS type A sorting domain-containing protein [Muribaculum sp.]